MKNKIAKSFLAVTISLFSIISCGNNFNEMMNQFKASEVTKKSVQEPIIINMPSVNYNIRPENTKIDTIIIHHTAPFASLTRLGYFFQDINTRVSAHYTVGKEGLIIQSVDEKNRAWHAGPSSWLGKYNVNDYSIGIEILNDGDGKDPFTPLQYNALNNLVTYLMKKYDVPLERVVGHRDIAFPLGRKSDPADNFDWKNFKSVLRTNLSIQKSMWGTNDNPQGSNAKLSDVMSNLYKDDINVKINAVDTLLTLDFKGREKQIDWTFIKEESPIVKSKYLRLFEIYENKNHIDYSYSILDTYISNPQLLLNQAISYLYFADKDKAYNKFLKLYNISEISKETKLSLTKILANYKKPETRDLFLSEMETNKDESTLKVIAENLAKFEDKSINDFLIKNFDTYPSSVKSILVETLRVTFDEKVENKLIEILNSTISKDVLEAVTWTILRKESKKAIQVLTNENIYSRLDDKLKSGLFNTIGKMNLTQYEDFLISKIKTENDVNAKSSLFLALGRLKGEKSFNLLINSFTNDKVLNLVLLKAISNYNKKEVNNIISNILRDEQYPDSIKILAISTIRENKLYSLLTILKLLYVETKSPEVDFYANETIKLLENGK